MTLAEYAEQKGSEKLRSVQADMEHLHEEARGLFTLIVAALAATVGYSFTLLRGGEYSVLLLVTAMTCLHLAGTAAYTLHRALGIRPASAPGNEPLKFLTPEARGFDLQAIIEAECGNIEASIFRNLDRNAETGRAIMRARAALIFTPLSALAAWVLAMLLESLWPV